MEGKVWRGRQQWVGEREELRLVAVFISPFGAKCVSPGSGLSVLGWPTSDQVSQRLPAQLIVLTFTQEEAMNKLTRAHTRASVPDSSSCRRVIRSGCWHALICSNLCLYVMLLLPLQARDTVAFGWEGPREMPRVYQDPLNTSKHFRSAFTFRTIQRLLPSTSYLIITSLYIYAKWHWRLL